MQSAMLACQVVLSCQAGKARTAVRAAQPVLAARLSTVDPYPTTSMLMSCLALVVACEASRGVTLLVERHVAAAAAKLRALLGRGNQQHCNYAGPKRDRSWRKLSRDE